MLGLRADGAWERLGQQLGMDGILDFGRCRTHRRLFPVPLAIFGMREDMNTRLVLCSPEVIADICCHGVGMSEIISHIDGTVSIPWPECSERLARASLSE